MIGKTGRCSLWSFVLVIVGGVFAGHGSGVEAAPGLSTAQPIAAYLNGAFPNSTPGASPDATWATQNAFPNLTFVEPVRIVEHPTLNKLVIVSKDGQVNLIDDDPAATTKSLFLDLRGKVRTPTVGEGGLSGLAFHPEFGLASSPNRGYVYVWYRAPSGGSSDGYQRLSRFSVPDGQNSVDPGSEFILIQQYDRSANHVGGDLFFGSDGFLYIPVGDEGNCCDRSLSTQRLDLGLFSGLLRIDVDQDPSRSHPIRRQPLNPAPPPSGSQGSFTQGYYIPDDNPFVDPSGANLEEFFALGLRHPWVVSRDPDTGDLWTGDVGEFAREEVNRIFKGANHQWAYKEGSLAGKIPQPGVVIGTEAPPIWEYDHTVGHAIIGAGVYRGSRFPELFGKYLFSDFTGGQLWTLAVPAAGGAAQVEQIAQIPSGFPNGINAYRLTDDGRILLAKTSGGLDPGGTLLELTRGGAVTAQPPSLLSQTGAFQNLATLEPAAGCLPYDLNVPFWSDAALKSRWMCIPNDSTHDTPQEQIQFSENGDWQFPVGAVLIKHFEMSVDEQNPGETRRLETRFLVHASDGYYGVTYKWRADGSDADLLYEGLDEAVQIQTLSGTRTQSWRYPSRNECLRCHTNNAGGVLGPKTRQLNRDLLYPSTGIDANQLETLNSLGIFSPPLDVADIPGFLTSAAGDDTSAGLAARARSYLDANCSYCHRPGGVRANFDARLTTPLANQGLVYGELLDSFGIAGEAVVVPESPGRSILHHRLSLPSDQNGMPPLAKNRVDTKGVQLIADWINSLGGFSVGNTTGGAPFVDSHNPSLFINESDTYTNNDGEAVPLKLVEFSFYANKAGNPITPLVVRVDGDNDFTVLAIGTTRTQSEYSPGANSFPFQDFTDRFITLQPGETIATGFLDSFPDGSGWGKGTVIPAVNSSSEDEIWALLPSPLILASNGFIAGRDTPRVVEGESPRVTNNGKALTEYTNLKRSYQFAIRFSYGFEDSGSPPPSPPPPGPVQSVELGNDPTSDAARVDGWRSNMLVNESDTYTNTSGAQQQVSIDSFSFYARRVADPVTPFVVRVNGDNNFTVVAIGTTRGNYSVGANSVPFSSAGAVQISLGPGEVLASGFLDANADGSGGGSGSVIPWDNGGDELWYTGGKEGTDSGSVTVGSAPQPGSKLLTTLQRNYRYRIGLTAGGSGGEAPVLSGLSVSPLNASVVVGESQGFSANGQDQFGAGYAATVLWSVSGGGTIATDGVFTATEAGGPFTVTATALEDAGISATAVVSVTPASTPTGNLALGQPVFASSQESGSLGPAKAVDGNGSTRWASAAGVDPQWLYVDLGAVYAVDRVVLDWERAYGKAYQIQVSDTANAWVTVYSESNSDGGIDDIGFSPVNARYVRMLGTVRGTKWGYSLWEMEVHGGSGGGGGGGAPNASLGNGSFELDPIASRSVVTSLTDWTVSSGDVALLPASFYVPPEGAQSLDLNGTQAGTIEQTVGGLKPSTLYALFLSYADQSRRGRTPELVTADILVNGAKIGAIRTTANAPAFITCNGFNFVSSPGGVAAIRIQSTVSGNYGAVIDDVRISEGGVPLPPESPAVVNGSFETRVSGNAHLCGDQLPGWRITQENVDLVGSGTWPAYDGGTSLDLSGHGPGAIAQTVTGLNPGQTYSFSFAYARHIHWGTVPLTAQVLVNGAVVAELTATTADYPPNWRTLAIPVVAPANGKLTLGFRSTAETTGGGVVIDDVKLVP